MSDAPPEIHATFTRPLRNKGPLRKAAGKKRGPYQKRTVEQREAETRTAADAGSGGIFDAPTAGIRMPRETGEFNPEYEGPGERMSRLDRDVNQFELPKSLRTKLRNAGWDAAYKTVKVLMADIQEVDSTEIRAAYSAGWRPAKAKDFPELCVPGTNPDATIDNNGQRLFIRPLTLTRKAQEEDLQFANQQMQSRMQATTEGRSVLSNEEGLSDMGKVVRPVHIALEVQGETGTHGVR